MRVVMELALRCAGLEPAAIGYVNGHGTATEQGDIAETRATSALFGPRMPLSSQKSYLGHTLGACGALESMFSIEMMRSGWFAPTVNLENVDPRCGELDYIVGDGRRLDVEYVMNNNFAFGGVNTSLVFRRWRLSDAFSRSPVESGEFLRSRGAAMCASQIPVACGSLAATAPRPARGAEPLRAARQLPGRFHCAC